MFSVPQCFVCSSMSFGNCFRELKPKYLHVLADGYFELSDEIPSTQAVAVKNPSGMLALERS